MESDGRQGHGEGNLAALDAFGGEEAALNVVVGGGGDFVVVDGDELDAAVLERERGVAVVGEDDADGKEAMLDVREAEEVAVLGVVAGFSRHGDEFFRVGIECGVLVGGFWGRGLSGFVRRKRSNREEARCSNYQERNLREWVGLHGQVDYHLRWRTT